MFFKTSDVLVYAKGPPRLFLTPMGLPEPQHCSQLQRPPPPSTPTPLSAREDVPAASRTRGDGILAGPAQVLLQGLREDHKASSSSERSSPAIRASMPGDG